MLGEAKGWVNDVAKRREKVVRVPEKVTKTGGGVGKVGKKQRERGEKGCGGGELKSGRTIAIPLRRSESQGIALIQLMMNAGDSHRNSDILAIWW